MSGYKRRSNKNSSVIWKKLNFTLEQALKPRGGVELYSYSFFNLGARRGWVVNATPRLLYPLERDPVPSVQEAGWYSGPVWTGAENLASMEIRSPDRPAPSESLYRTPSRPTPMETLPITILWTCARFSVSSIPSPTLQIACTLLGERCQMRGNKKATWNDTRRF